MTHPELVPLRYKVEKIIVGIIEVEIPSYESLSDRIRDDVLKDVSDFVNSHISGMAFFLRVPVIILIIVFDLFSIIVNCRSFYYLDVPGRRRHIKKAERFPVLPFSDMLKLIRSFMLLRYYNHQAVRKGIDFDWPSLEMREQVK